MNPKVKIASLALTGLLILIMAAFLVSLKRPDLKPQDVINTYNQWAVYLIGGSGKACSLMTEDAQQAYVQEVAVPEKTSCQEAVSLVKDSLDIREPFEPYAVIENINKNIKRVKLDGDKGFVWTTDFKNAKSPVVLTYQDKWLISKESFPSQPSQPIQWANGSRR